MVAIDADGREIADPAEARAGRPAAARRARRARIAGFAGRDRDDEMGGVGPSAASRSGPSLRRRRRAAARCRPPTAPRASPACASCRRSPSPSGLARGECPGRIAGAEDQDAGAVHAASSHSARHRRVAPPTASRSSGDALAARGRLGEPPHRPDGGAAHQRATASASSARQCGNSAASPELPAAISTLRRKRSRPMRLTGEPANKARKPASSSRQKQVQRRRLQVVARDELRLGGAAGELVPGADGEAVVAAIDAVADRLAEFARDRPLVLDGQVGDAAPRVELVGRREGVRSGRCRGRRGRSRNGRSPAASAASSAVVKIAPRNSQEPSSRLTRLVCLPCQPSPAASASGFSMTGAVSTNTLTSPPARAAKRPAISFSRPLMTS